MSEQQVRRSQQYLLKVLFFSGFLVLVLSLMLGRGLAYDRSTTTTLVNITRALPFVDTIIVNQGNPINLTEGSLFNVTCNATVRNYNGLDDINKVNATFFRVNYSVFGPTDNNSLYHSENNCSLVQTVNSYTFRFMCSFWNVTYYAYNGSWNCTVWVNNSYNIPQNGTNSSYIYPLWAMNVTDVVDFGDLVVFDTSGQKTVNVTNFGNMALNLTVYGYGGTANATGGGLSFVCPSGTNISVDNLRWDVEGTRPYTDMVPLTSGQRTMSNLTLYKQYNDSYMFNTTYWALYVPPNPFGLCNGTITFEGQVAGSNG